MPFFTGRVIAITGAASGIGLATAQLLHSRGASLALADVSEVALKDFTTSLPLLPGQKVICTVVDVTDTAQVNSWLEEIISKFGKLDGAANIAGIAGLPTLLQDMTDETWNMVLSVNATGVFKCLRAELRHMADGGSIVNAASVTGLIGVTKSGHYVASKHAMIGLTKTAAKEAGSRNIRVNAVAPGFIHTPMLIEASEEAKRQEGTEASTWANPETVPLGRLGQAEEVGKLIAWLLSDEASYVNTEVVRVDGGMLG